MPSAAGCPAGWTTLPLLDFACPTTQSQAGGYVCRQRIPPPPRRHVRGLVTPCAAVTSGPADTCVSERPWASPFKVFPSPQSVPLSGPLPSCRYPPPPHHPEGWHLGNAAGFRASFLRRIRSVTGITRIPAVDTFLGFDPPEPAPIRPGARFRRGASPLALGRLDVQARLGLRVLRCAWVGRSVSGPPTLLGFSTFRRSRRSVHRSSGRAYGFASRPAPPKGRAERSKPLGRDATTNPGLVARHRRHSACDR
jgi:hypothetical protein